jgi:hypothetical protein
MALFAFTITKCGRRTEMLNTAYYWASSSHLWSKQCSSQIHLHLSGHLTHSWHMGNASGSNHHPCQMSHLFTTWSENDVSFWSESSIQKKNVYACETTMLPVGTYSPFSNWFGYFIEIWYECYATAWHTNTIAEAWSHGLGATTGAIM